MAPEINLPKSATTPSGSTGVKGRGSWANKGLLRIKVSEITKRKRRVFFFIAFPLFSFKEDYIFLKNQCQ